MLEKKDEDTLYAQSSHTIDGLWHLDEKLDNIIAGAYQEPEFDPKDPDTIEVERLRKKWNETMDSYIKEVDEHDKINKIEGEKQKRKENKGKEGKEKSRKSSKNKTKSGKRDKKTTLKTKIETIDRVNFRYIWYYIAT